MTKQYTILLADDHSILRAGLCSILNSKSDFDVVAEVDNGMDAIKSALAFKPDLLLTDYPCQKRMALKPLVKLKKGYPILNAWY